MSHQLSLFSVLMVNPKDLRARELLYARGLRLLKCDLEEDSLSWLVQSEKHRVVQESRVDGVLVLASEKKLTGVRKKVVRDGYCG